MSIYAMEAGDFHSKLTLYSACRLAGRMAILTMEAEGFQSKNSIFRQPNSKASYPFKYYSNS